MYFIEAAAQTEVYKKSTDRDVNSKWSSVTEGDK
jgi:hypothetical protein